MNSLDWRRSKVLDTNMSSKEDSDSKESKEPDYDDDKDQLEEVQEEEAGEIDKETTNQTF